MDKERLYFLPRSSSIIELQASNPQLIALNHKTTITTEMFVIINQFKITTRNALMLNSNLKLFLLFM